MILPELQMDLAALARKQGLLPFDKVGISCRLLLVLRPSAFGKGTLRGEETPQEIVYGARGDDEVVQAQHEPLRRGLRRPEQVSCVVRHHLIIAASSIGYFLRRLFSAQRAFAEGRGHAARRRDSSRNSLWSSRR